MNKIIEYRKLERKLGTDIFYILMDFIDDTQFKLNKQKNKFHYNFDKLEKLFRLDYEVRRYMANNVNNGRASEQLRQYAISYSKFFNHSRLINHLNI